MSVDKCCGNCKFFQTEDEEYGWCDRTKTESHHELSCECHEYGWTEITPDNKHEITDEIYDRVIIGTIDCRGKMHIAPLANYFMGIGTMAKVGGCYYYVLPELKKEETKNEF